MGVHTLGDSTVRFEKERRTMAPMASLGDKDVTTTIRQVSMIIRDRCILSVLIELCIKAKTVCICIYNYYYNLLRQKEHYNNNVQVCARGGSKEECVRARERACIRVCMCERKRREERFM